MKKIILIVCIIGLLGLNACKEKEAAPEVLKVYSITEKVNGIGYNELAAADARRSLELAADESNPYIDETGAASSTEKQAIKGFTILTSNFGGKSTRTLSIPSENYVYVSALGAVVWYFENDKCDPDFKPKVGQSTKDFLFETLAGFINLDNGIISVTLDGTELVTDKTKFRFKSDVFESIIHKDYTSQFPDCDYTGQKAKLVSDGYSLLMKIPKGKHTLVMKGTIPAEDPADTFEAEVTWNLTIE